MDTFLKKVSELGLTDLLTDVLEGQLDEDSFNRSVEDVQDILGNMIEMAIEAPVPNSSEKKEVVIDEEDTISKCALIVRKTIEKRFFDFSADSCHNDGAIQLDKGNNNNRFGYCRSITAKPTYIKKEKDIPRLPEI